MELKVAELLDDFLEDFRVVNLDHSRVEGTRQVSPDLGLVLEVVACQFLDELRDLSRSDLVRGQVVQEKDVLLSGEDLVHLWLRAGCLIIIRLEG